MATIDLPPLSAMSQGVVFSGRSALRTRGALASSHGRISRASPAGDYIKGDAGYTVIEIEAILRDKIRAKHATLMQAFQKYDKETSLSVTRGEFRRVVEAHCINLNTEQFDSVMAKVDTNPNGTVRYAEFLDKFSGGQVHMKRALSVVGNDKPSARPATGSVDPNYDSVERMLCEKVRKNSSEIMKAFRLCDYNRDGRVQRHDFRRVLEHNCFRLSDYQFEKLWSRHDFQRSGVMDYKDFLRRMGVRQESQDAPSAGGLPWEQPLKRQVTVMRGLIVQPESGPTIETLDAIFRKKMKYNYLNLKKAFMTFDPNLTGFVTIDELKSVINNFCMPISDYVFIHLMDRCHVKASGKVAWEAFLDKFQDPQGAANGQSVTIGTNHKFHPVRGDNPVSIGQILRLLDARVKGGYSSLQQAFLQFDKNRNGRVSQKEFRKILEGFSFRLSDEQFKDVMMLLDPEGKQVLDYHRFLALFEEGEDISAHRWLVSNHRVNQPKPLIVAWQTVEDLLQEKITENWHDFQAAIVAADPHSEGLIDPAQLKAIVERLILPVSDEHFNSMMQGLEWRAEDGRVRYCEWLERLGVNVGAGDTQGLSLQIQQGSIEAEARRRADIVIRTQHNDENAQGRTMDMECDEMIARIKDRMRQHFTELRRAYTMMDTRKKGKLSKKDFRAVLERRFGMSMTNEKFQQLTVACGFHNGHLTYTDFLHTFEDPRPNGAPESLERPNNHRVDPIRGDGYGMTAEQAADKLRLKLRDNFGDLREAFYKFSPTHNSHVSRGDFRRVLDAMMIILSDNEFERFCQMCGLEGSGTIDYHAFLKRFEVKDDMVEGHKWLNSQHRFNATIPPRMMSAEEVHFVLAEKAHRQYYDVAQAFRVMDSDGDAQVRQGELKEMLAKFVCPMTREEFARLWNILDPERRGSLKFADFLQRLAAYHYTPGDKGGVSADVITGSYLAIEEHHNKQQAAHEDVTRAQAFRSSKMAPTEVLTRIKDLIRDRYEDFRQAFQKYDKGQRGHVTERDVQQMLVDLNLFLDDQTYTAFIDSIGLTPVGAKLDYWQFLKVFEEGRADNYGSAGRETLKWKQEEGLSPVQAEAQVRELVAANHEAIKKAFQALDRANAGRVSNSDFRRVIDNFCFPMTEPQARHLLGKARTSAGYVDYNAFIQDFASTVLNNETWQQTLNRLTRENETQAMDRRVTPNVFAPAAHMQEMRDPRGAFSELMSSAASVNSLRQCCQQLDPQETGMVEREAFRVLLNQQGYAFTDPEFDVLWGSLPTTAVGVQYTELLPPRVLPIPRITSEPTRLASLGQRATPKPLPTAQSAVFSRRPTSANVDASSNKRGPVGTSLRMQRSVTQVEMAPKSPEKRLQEAIRLHWTKVKARCQKKDVAKKGMCTVQDFIDAFEGYAPSLSPAEWDSVLPAFGLRKGGKMAYITFLKNHVLTLNAVTEGCPVDERRKLQDTKVQTPQSQLLIGPGVKTDGFMAVMFQLRPLVLGSWKDLRRAFRTLDPRGLGVVNPVQFRSVLQRYGMPISEDNFYHLLSYYDKKLEGRIPYNDFIGAFLRTA